MQRTVDDLPGFLGGLFYDVVVENHAYCAKQVPKTRAQLEALVRDPKSGKSIDIFPRPKERLTFRDGYFRSGEKPVFMMGMCLFALWPELEQMRKMNFNLVHVSEYVDALFPDPETEAATGELLLADGNPKYKLVDFLDKCSELGIKVDLGLTARPPSWFFDKHPDARLQGHSVAGFIPFDIESPETLAWIEKYFAAIMPSIANHPAINSIWLANEPTMLNFGPRSTELFRAEMCKKYGTLGKLNEAWGTTYASFGEIPVGLGKPDGNGAVDFWWFNLGRLTHFFEFMQQCVRKYDKTVNTCFKLNNLQMGWYCPPQNVDQEGVTDISEIVGMDSGTYPFAKPYYDWLRSLSPEKPMVNLEFKGGGRRTQLDIWKAALSLGHAGIDWWCWHPKPTFSRAMCDTVALHEGSLAMYNIQRNFDVVRAFHNFPRSPFVVLYPDPVLPRAWHYFQAHTPTVNAIKYMGHAVDYATEKRIAAGRLDEMQYDIIVLPAANYIKDETFARVGAFVERGGKAVVVGDLPTLDPMGNPRDLGWLKAPADAKPALPDCTNGVVFAHGKGTVWILPKEEEKIIQSRLEAIAAQVLPPLPVVIQDEVEFRTIPWKNERGEAAYVTFILNEWSHGADRPIQADFRVPVREAVDLMTGEPVDVTRIAMPPLSARLIQWTPAE